MKKDDEMRQRRRGKESASATYIQSQRRRNKLIKMKRYTLRTDTRKRSQRVRYKQI